MEVSNVRSHTVSGSFMGHYCLVNGCMGKKIKVLSFSGDEHNLSSIFGNIAIYSSRNNMCYICSCTDHMCYLELLGHTMAVYHNITKQIVEDVLHVDQGKINGMIVDYKGYIMIRCLLGFALDENGVSRAEICDFMTRILRYYIENINIITYQNPIYLKLIGEKFTQIHSNDAITLFIELRNKFKSIPFFPQYSDFLRDSSVVANEMIDFMQHSKLVNILRMKAREYN